MILDGLLTFTGTSQGASGGIASGPQTDSPTTGTQDASNVLDLGVTSGVPSSANGGGARDIGQGNDTRIALKVIVTTKFVGATNMYVVLSGAPDNGSGAPGSYTTMWTGPTIVEADLIQGAELANVDIPRVVWEQVLPRFLQLSFVTDGTHTAGAVEGTLAVAAPDEQVFSSDGYQSGYPAGVVVAN